MATTRREDCNVYKIAIDSGTETLIFKVFKATKIRDGPIIEYFQNLVGSIVQPSAYS